ncbi:MAG: Maf family protein [Candidatus Peribacteraceae bacterium]
MQIILASASPQRKTLLEGLGIPFQVIVPSVDESLHPERDPVRRAETLARLKAESVHELHPHAIVIGCDTLVVASDGTLLEKPADETEARVMLQKHSGNVSFVHSALAVIGEDGVTHEGISTSSVLFKKLTKEEMDWWTESGLWRDRSGGFQIDGPGQLMIEGIEGDWTGVVGLPVFLLGQLMKRATGVMWNCT